MLSAEQKAEADNTCQDLDLPDITKTESNNCFIKYIVLTKRMTKTLLHGTELTLLLEFMHNFNCMRNQQISHLSASR